MPLGDFSVEGIIDAKESLSDKAKDITGSLYGAADAADEAGDQVSSAIDDFGALAGAAESLDFTVDQVEEEFEELNDEVQEGLANLQAMQGEMVATGGSAQVLRSSLEGIDADQIVESESFKGRLMDFFEDEGVDRSAIGGALGNFMQSQDDQTLGDLVERIRGRADTDVSTRVATEGVAQATTELGAYTSVAEKAEDATDDVEDETRDLALAQIGLTGSFGVTQSALASFIVGLSKTERQLDDVEDELDSVARSAAALGPALSTVSANIGPFNVALSNVLVTIPAIFATVGPLVAVLGGLAAAFLAVAAAMGALMAVGFLGLAESLEQNFASIENKMQAVEAIAKGLGMALKEAIQPLMGAEIAGLGPIEFFVRILQNFVAWVRIASEVLAELLGMEEVEEFFFRIEGALLGTSDAAQSSMSMLEGLTVVVEEALPVLTDVLVFLITHLPEAMAFMAEVTGDLSDTLGETTLAFIDFVVVLIRFGTSLLNHVLPVLTTVVEMLTFVIGGLNQLGQALGPVGDAMIGMAGIALTLALTYARLNSVVRNFARLLVPFISGDLVAAQQMLSAMAAAVIQLVAGLGLITVGLLLVEDGLNEFGLSLTMILDLLGAILGPIAELVGGLGDLSASLSNTIPFFDKIIALAEIAIGLYITYQGVLVAVSGAQALAATTAGSYALTLASSLVPALGSAIASILMATGGLWGLVSAETTATIASQGLTGAVWSLVASLSALQIVTGVVLIAALAGMAAAFYKLDGAAAVAALGITTAIAAITAAFLGSGWGAIIIALGGLIGILIKVEEAWGGMAAAAVAAIGAITVALIGSGWGAILVALGLLLAGLYLAWDDIVSIVSDAVSWFDQLGIIGKAAVLAILAPISPLIAALLAVRELIKLIMNPEETLARWWKDIQNGIDMIREAVDSTLGALISFIHDPIGGIMALFDWIKGGVQAILSRIGGEAAGKGLGGRAKSTVTETAKGAAAGAAIGSVVPGVGTAVGAGIGGAAGFVDANVVDLPVLQQGGFIESSGLAFLHSNEYVIPAHKLQQVMASANIGGPTRTVPMGAGGGSTTNQTNVQVQVEPGADGMTNRERYRIGRTVRDYTRREQRRNTGN